MMDLIHRFLASDYPDFIVQELSVAKEFVPLAFALPQLKRLSGELRIMTAYLALAILFTVTLTVMCAYRINNLNLMNLFTWVETFTYCYVFGKWLNSKIAFKLAMSGFACFSFYFLYTFQVDQFNTGVEVFEGIIVICLASFLLFKISINTNDIIYKDFRFWFTAPTLLLLGINIMTLGLYNNLLSMNPELVKLSTVIYTLTGILTHCLFAYGFVCYKRKMKSYLPFAN